MAPIFLIGFMGAGKTAIAPLLAQRLGISWLDLDDYIESNSHRSISNLFADEGEAGFREREADALCTVWQTDQVISTGGGTPCFRDNLAQMLERGTVIHLAADLPTCLSRADFQTRPLLTQDPQDISALYERRQPVYRRAHINVSTEERRPEEVVDAIFAALQVQKNLVAPPKSQATIVSLKTRSYPIVVASGCLESLGAELQRQLPKAKTLGLVTDDNVRPLYGDSLNTSLKAAGFRVVTASVRPGETSKTLEVVGEVCDTFIEGGLDRQSVVVALGGGVVGDLAGFVASCLFRGIPVVQVPTTLLAMTDSAIGGKTGVNRALGKNLIGTFWQPHLVWADTDTLKTLPRRERRAAFGELVKYALLDAELWPDIERLPALIAGDGVTMEPRVLRAIRACAAVKASIVSLDERESGLRATLNLGHTLGHAIEASTGYATVLHGEAVALGLLAACRVSARLYGQNDDLELRVRNVLATAGLDTDLTPWLVPNVLSHMSRDKKRDGSAVRFIVVREPGVVHGTVLELCELTRLLGPS